MLGISQENEAGLPLMNFMAAVKTRGQVHILWAFSDEDMERAIREACAMGQVLEVKRFYSREVGA